MGRSRRFALAVVVLLACGEDEPEAPQAPLVQEQVTPPEGVHDE